MTKNNTPDPRVVYADIIDLPHWESPTRPRMSRYNRAAQFSPFAALTGYDDIIREEARETGTWIEPGESQKEQIDWRLNEIERNLLIAAEGGSERSRFSPVPAEGGVGGDRKAPQQYSLTFFVPDTKKDGGEYVTAKGSVRKIDPVRRKLRLSDENGQIQEIDLDRITSIDPD